MQGHALDHPSEAWKYASPEPPASGHLCKTLDLQ